MKAKVDCRFVWMDGEIVPAEEARVSFFAHALHYGTAVFEGIRCYAGKSGPAIFRAAEHMERLRRSAARYYMEYDFRDEALVEASRELIKKHGFSECYIRPLVLTGAGRMGVRPRDCPINVLIGVWSWGAYLGPEALEHGISAKIVSTIKFSPEALDPTAKASGHYLNSVRATCEAAAAGYDEGILLNAHGRVAEGAGENIFVVKDGVVVTNPPEESLLLGVTRDSVLTIARDLGLETAVAPIRVEDLFAADEAFFTGTAAEVTPIAKVNERTIGGGGRGEITARLQREYLATVRGERERYARWLTPA